MVRCSEFNQSFSGWGYNWAWGGDCSASSGDSSRPRRAHQPSNALQKSWCPKIFLELGLSWLCICLCLCDVWGDFWSLQAKISQAWKGFIRRGTTLPSKGLFLCIYSTFSSTDQIMSSRICAMSELLLVNDLNSKSLAVLSVRASFFPRFWPQVLPSISIQAQSLQYLDFLVCGVIYERQF